MNGPTEAEVAAMCARLRTQLVMAMFLTRDDLYRAHEKQRCDAADLLETISAQLTASEAQREAAEARVGNAKNDGYLDGYGAAVSDVEAMRASDGLLRGQSLIVSGLKISLTKMTAAIKGAKP